MENLFIYMSKDHFSTYQKERWVVIWSLSFYFLYFMTLHLFLVRSLLKFIWYKNGPFLWEPQTGNNCSSPHNYKRRMHILTKRIQIIYSSKYAIANMICCNCTKFSINENIKYKFCNPSWIFLDQIRYKNSFLWSICFFARQRIGQEDDTPASEVSTQS